MRRSIGLASVMMGLALSLAVPAKAEWYQATSKHFIVYAEGNGERVKERAEELERFDSVFRYFQKVPARPEEESNKLTVYVVSNDNAVRRLYGSNSASIAGFYDGRASGSVAFTPREMGGELNEARIVLFHEYAHHLLLGNFAAAYPAWFSEGYAEFLSTVSFDKENAWIGKAAQHRAYTLLQGEPLSASDLFSANMRTIRKNQMPGLYARGWLLTHYILVGAAPERREQFGKYLQALNAGKPGLDAAREAFGDLKQLDKELDAQLKGRTIPALRFSLDKLPQPVVEVRALTPGEKAMIGLRMRSDRGVNAETAGPILKDAIPIGERYPDDAVVQGWLAEMALDAGRYDLAEAAADRALAINPKSSQALIYKAQVRINRAREAKVTDRAVWDEARKWLLRANRIDPNDAYTLLLYYSSFGMAGMVPTANAKDALARAHELVPQDSQLRFAYAYQSLADDRVEDAKLALRPLAYSAHAAPDNKAAQMLAMLEAKKSAREVMGAQTISISGSPQAD
jgi:tetratricopeptide (TPR) repeat protein